jgi:hypothetical protein
LHNESFRDNRTLNHWLWEYKCHHSECSVFAVVCDNEKIVGTQGFIPIYLNVQGEKCLSAKSENSLLKPEYRKGTLFKELYAFGLLNCTQRKVCLVWGMTPAVKVWRDKLGFSVFPNAKYTSVCLLKPGSFLKRILKSTSGLNKVFLLLSILPVYANSWFRMNTRYVSKKKLAIFSVESELRDFIDLENLYGRLKAKGDFIHIVQDEAFLKWRVNTNPNVKYSRYFVYQEGVLRAYCYLNVNGGEVYFTDFTFETKEAAEALMKHVLKELPSQNPMAIYFTGNIENPLIFQTFSFLKKYGFVKRKDGEAFVILNLSLKDKDFLYDIHNWYINGLWTEGYTW